eukprot:628963-Rhodomonas_salina.1
MHCIPTTHSGAHASARKAERERADLYAVDHHEHNGLGHGVEDGGAHDPEVVLQQLPQHVRF